MFGLFESGRFTEVYCILYIVFQKGTVDEDMAPASVVTFTKGSYLRWFVYERDQL